MNLQLCLARQCPHRCVPVTVPARPLTQRVFLHTDYRLLVVPAIYVVTPGAYLLVASKGCNSSQLEAHSACLLTCHPQPIVDGVRFHVVPLKSWLSPSWEVNSQNRDHFILLWPAFNHIRRGGLVSTEKNLT